VKDFDGETGKYYMENPGMYGRMILKWIFEK
jgi:hypothetical protein